MSDLSLPADYPTIPASVYDDAKLVKLAREIAMGLKEVADILSDHGISVDEFERIQHIPAFAKMLASELAAWASATNTQERVKLKAGSMLEEFLPELYSRLNDRTEPLMGKVKAMELVTKMAGFGDRDIQSQGSPGDQVQVIINLGADTKIEYQKRLPAKVIEHVPSVSIDDAFTESLDARADQV